MDGLGLAEILTEILDNIIGISSIDSMRPVISIKSDIPTLGDVIVSD